MNQEQELPDRETFIRNQEQDLPEIILGVPRDVFLEEFFDVRRHKPQQGQVMAKFQAVAEFVDGREKRDIIGLLKIDKAKQAAMVMRKIHLAREPDCYRVLREMCEDMLMGMSDEEVEKKAYEFVLEAFFYTKRENIPEDDPRWSTIQILEWDEENKTFKSHVKI